MKNFIEVTLLDGTQILLNLRAIEMVKSRVSYKDVDRGKELGCVITTVLLGINEDDVSISVIESYAAIKDLIKGAE